jgi:hypothetical protein
MTTVVLGGSRQISRLTAELERRLDRIIDQRLHVVVGDANGADKAMQRYLAERRHADVEVFCAGATPRNNVGGWPCRRVETKARPGTFEFYAAKDQAMAAAANVGFMLWDGESVGTLMNVWRLLRGQKSTLVAVQPTRALLEVRSEPDWQRLLAGASEATRADLARRIRSEQAAEEQALPLFGEGLGQPSVS